MRLIDADAFRHRILCQPHKLSVNEVLELISTMPTADVPERNVRKWTKIGDRAYITKVIFRGEELLLPHPIYIDVDDCKKFVHGEDLLLYLFVKSISEYVKNKKGEHYGGN